MTEIINNMFICRMQVRALRGTSLAGKADAILAAAEASWAELRPLVEAAEKVGGGSATDFSGRITCRQIPVLNDIGLLINCFTLPKITYACLR